MSASGKGRHGPDGGGMTKDKGPRTIRQTVDVKRQTSNVKRQADLTVKAGARTAKDAKAGYIWHDPSRPSVAWSDNGAPVLFVWLVASYIQVPDIRNRRNVEP